MFDWYTGVMSSKNDNSNYGPLLEQVIRQNNLVIQQNKQIADRNEQVMQRNEQVMQHNEKSVKHVEHIAEDIHAKAALMEQIIEQNNILIENIGDMRDKVNMIPIILQRLDGHDKQFEVIKLAIKENSKDIQKNTVDIQSLRRGLAAVSRP